MPVTILHSSTAAIILSAALVALPSMLYAGNVHPDEPGASHVELAATTAEKAAIGSAIATSGEIERHIEVYGRLVTPPTNRAVVTARFPGVITDIRITTGDRVKQGDVLATIESNESLQPYSLRAPIDALIQDRMANIGESTTESPLFILVNDELLWAELKIFPNQRTEVAAGQAVHVLHNRHRHDSTIASITPTGGDEPYLLARVPLDNTSGDLAPGELVSAEIDAERVQVAVVVAAQALQQFQGSAVVFVQTGDKYHARPVETGRTDGDFTEILTGLRAGERYVVTNSFLLKADLEKSGAAHDH